MQQSTVHTEVGLRSSNGRSAFELQLNRSRIVYSYNRRIKSYPLQRLVATCHVLVVASFFSTAICRGCIDWPSVVSAVHPRRSHAAAVHDAWVLYARLTRLPLPRRPGRSVGARATRRRHLTHVQR